MTALDLANLTKRHGGGAALDDVSLSAADRAIPVERMRQANLMVDRDRDKRTPEQAARWLDPAPD